MFVAIRNKNSDAKRVFLAYVARHPALIFWRVLLGLSIVLVLVACESLGYYAQAAAGQLSLIRDARPINTLLDEPELSIGLRRQLGLVMELRTFAEAELALPVGSQYSQYANLERDSVVWNVFAAPSLHLEPKTWCYPLVGCSAYRGYFDERSALSYAGDLSEQGYDTYVGGVAAYSTLGWLNDPVLNTFIYREESQLADLVFHELAHQLLYVPGDTVFNESFATAVAMEGVRRWMLKRDNPAQYLRYLEGRSKQGQFIALIGRHRDRLAKLYESAADTHEQHRQKTLQISLLRDDFAILQQQWGDDESYSNWMAAPINNAKLISVGLYFDLLPGFQQLLSSSDSNLEKFYTNCQALAGLDYESRRAPLATPVN
jgi:predicted aminopeptidase